MSHSIEFDCVSVKQGKQTLYLFAAPAKLLWDLLRINEREEDKEEGYQRTLSVSRARSIAAYVDSGNALGPSLLVTLEAARYDEDRRKIVISRTSDSGWVIDGQHRLRGARDAQEEIDLPVVAFLNLDLDQQIQQFVTVNKEAKGVPASLYYNLLKHIPHKSPLDKAKEMANDIGTALKKDEDSPFFGRVVSTTSPKKGEISMNNFVRKVYPLIQDQKGILAPWTEPEQTKIIDNYYRGLANVFASEFRKVDCIFFKTLGFGAAMNALPKAFSLCVKHFQGFTAADTTKLFSEIRHFNVEAWRSYGTGNAAEIQAGRDLETELEAAFSTVGGGSLKL